VAAIAIVVVGAVPAEVGGVALVLTALVMLGRVYVGAHNPLDVSAGLGAGLVVGGLLAAVLR
jgi:membrane-associated phospholipid phosphatase